MLGSIFMCKYLGVFRSHLYGIIVNSETVEHKTVGPL